jgi:hypothetical protein
VREAAEKLVDHGNRLTWIDNQLADINGRLTAIDSRFPGIESLRSRCQRASTTQ